MNTHWLTLHDVVYQRQQEELERRLHHRFFYGTDWEQTRPATLWMRMRRQTRSWLDRLAVRRQTLKPVQSA